MVNKIQTEIDTAQISLHNALVTMTEQKKNMELAEQVYNQAKLKYERGLGSNLEVTNAEAELKTAQNNYFSSLYDAVVAKIEYLRATGKL
ncbi:TolC family protein [Paraflavitalea speifideaquila]|uniref:TolC family protein n=1 Tax=Paraflavitalea speifideaquila TaxID=3076558 RepID=UPI0028EBF725|nr:TolC family protein [Paraflavitalea speifideiaquila]